MTNDIKKIVFFVLLLGLTYIAHAYMVRPINNNLSEKSTLAQIRLKKLTQLSQLAESKNAVFAAKYLGQQIEHLESAIKFFESRLPSKDEVHGVIEQVVVIAQKQGLKPKTIRTLDIKKNNTMGCMEQPLKMGLDGDFKSFYSFLLEIEKLPRIVKIRELKLTKTPSSGAESQQEQIMADLVVSIFFRGE